MTKTTNNTEPILWLSYFANWPPINFICIAWYNLFSGINLSKCAECKYCSVESPPLWKANKSYTSLCRSMSTTKPTAK